MRIRRKRARRKRGEPVGGGIAHVQKRDGRIVPFDSTKIEDAISKAMAAVGKKDGRLAKSVAGKAAAAIEKKFARRIPHVEDVQDSIEEALVGAELAGVAKAYILYRRKRGEEREVKTFFGVKDDLKMGINAVKVMQKRYLKKDEAGRAAETPSGMFRRVARAVASAERGREREKWADAFYEAMAAREFMPNSPTLMNAGTRLGQLSACFVLPVGDSLHGIFGSVEHMAVIQQSGGGTGFSFSRLRPKGDIVKSTMGIASGPVSFMGVFNAATEVIRQGGRRRGANMGVLRCDHPDILEFVRCKEKPGSFANFNISVAATDEFMRAVEANADYELVNPRTSAVARRLNARSVFNLICTMAWETGDPGIIFIDEVNRRHPLKRLGEIEATNPCGEQPLLPYESCNLGSINLERCAEKGEIAWGKLGGLVRLGVRFLDDVISVNRYPLSQVRDITHANRKIGLGVMGFADMLTKMGMPYDSKEALGAGGRVMRFIFSEAQKESARLGAERGSFPNFGLSTWKGKHRAMRNSTVCTVAPTGTISIIAGCSSGIEPLFAVSFVRDVMEGTRLVETNAQFEKVARERGFHSRELMMRIAKRGSIEGMREIPRDVREVFVTAMDISPEWHVRMQAAFQRHCDNAVSKTINLPKGATPEDVRRAYLLAHRLRCKGITVYRYGSKPEQVLYIGGADERGEKDFVSADSEFAGGCPAPVCPPAMV